MLELTAYPALSDAVYIASYGLMAAGLVVIVRRRGSRGDLPALLDAAILATGTAVVAGVFVISPIAGDSSLSLLGKLTSSLYPIADILLLGILARLWTTPGARTTAFKLLAAALRGDPRRRRPLQRHRPPERRRQLAAGQRPALAERLRADRRRGLVTLGPRASPSRCPGREDLADPTKRMVVLTGGLLLPALALLGDDLNGGGVSGVLIATGSIVLSILVLGRMAGLLSVVRAQAVQLAALARSDELTGRAQPPDPRPRAVARLSGRRATTRRR